MPGYDKKKIETIVKSYLSKVGMDVPKELVEAIESDIRISESGAICSKPFVKPVNLMFSEKKY